MNSISRPPGSRRSSFHSLTVIAQIAFTRPPWPHKVYVIDTDGTNESLLPGQSGQNRDPFCWLLFRKRRDWRRCVCGATGDRTDLGETHQDHGQAG